MLEIILLIVLSGKISDMARRRGRSPILFDLLLLICWFGGEVAGAVLGYTLSLEAANGTLNMLLTYALALCGAAAGSGLAFLVARSLSPVDGEWRDLAVLPVRRSRLLGVVMGGGGGGVIGAILVGMMYGGMQTMVQGFLALGFIGALLGLVSGVQKE